jgi:hypothetical protein
MQDIVPARSDRSRGAGWTSLIAQFGFQGSSLNACGSIQHRRIADGAVAQLVER